MEAQNLFYAVMQSPIGKLHLISDDREVLAIGFKDEWKLKPKTGSVLKVAMRQLDEYFSGKRKTFDLPLKMTGSPFQLKAWKELCKIPYGKTISYKDQATKLGSSKAFRAVGSANGKNRFPIVIPCHRVIAADGGLGGYAGGLKIKTRLLQLEQRLAH